MRRRAKGCGAEHFRPKDRLSSPQDSLLRPKDRRDVVNFDIMLRLPAGFRRLCRGKGTPAARICTVRRESLTLHGATDLRVGPEMSQNPRGGRLRGARLSRGKCDSCRYDPPFFAGAIAAGGRWEFRLHVLTTSLPGHCGGMESWEPPRVHEEMPCRFQAALGYILCFRAAGGIRCRPDDEPGSDLGAGQGALSGE